jgi:hypothetical protein
MIDEIWFSFFVGFIVGGIPMIGLGYVMYLRKVEEGE